MKKFFLCATGALSLLASSYLAFTGRGSEVIYGALIVVAVTCVILASIKQVPATTPLLESKKCLSAVIGTAVSELTFFDYMVLGTCALLLSTLAVILPPVFIFVMAVFMSGAGVGLLFWVLSKHTRC